MNEREQLIEKLVTTMHLNVPERAALSSHSVRYSEVAAVVARVLEDAGYFPPNARPWQAGNVVHEGAILQKLSGGGFRLTLQRSHPTAPTVLAAKQEADFRDARAAIKAFISSEWPKGIDGIPIKRLIRTLLSLLVFALPLIKLERHIHLHLCVYRFATDRGGFIADLRARTGSW